MNEAGCPVTSRSPDERRRLLRQRLPAILLFSFVFLASALLPLLGGTEIRLCGFYLITGVPCAGCGLGRSFCAMTWGQPLEALHYHLLGPVLYLAAAGFLLGQLVEVGWGRRLPVPDWFRRITRPIPYLLLAAALLAWIVRLVGYWPLPPG